nr:MAG TPA: hypothetical protein [Caudoviricetes sp.]
MSDYINRNIAIARLTALEVQNPIATMRDAKRVLADMPVADTVEVVRCKNCIYAQDFDDDDARHDIGRICMCASDEDYILTRWADDFCSCGKRRDDDGRRSD